VKEIIIILHNIRSTHNVGSILRTAEGLGVKKVIFCGYTPYPKNTRIASDTASIRLPHITEKLTTQIRKTALGAEELLKMEYHTAPPIAALKVDGFRVVALEQQEGSTKLNRYYPPEKIALVLGEEVNGIPADLIEQCEDIVEIPMHGKKESFNVSVAAGIALYALTQES
jgi:23S rRNA (guanosine2251-2'-O)-methyltransferase